MIKWFGRLGAVGAGAVGARWSPADLFANGEQGSFWGPLPYYSDAAGTVEADWGDPVGFIPDASGNGTDWTQVTSTARPILRDSPPRLEFDGTDDDIPNTLPAIQGTIVLAGTNGIWIDELNFAGGTFSVGPGTYTGGPAGLMAILGDILERGCFVIDRALTPEEIAQVKKYYKARGSAGLFELGPEMVVNGTFDDNIDGWGPSHPDGRVTLSWDDGAIRMVGPSELGGAQQTGLYLSDVFVVVEGTLVSTTGSGSRIRLTITTAPGSIRFESRSSSVAGDRVRAITYLDATGQTTAIYLRGNTPPYDIKWDNVSLRKLELIP